MKAIIILLLVLSTLVVGCASQTPTSGGGEAAQGEVTQADALGEVDNSLVAEDSDIEIGEMI